MRGAAVLPLVCGWLTAALVGQLTPVQGAGESPQAPPRQPSPTLEQLWADLASAESTRVERAVEQLARRSEEAVPFLKARLRPVKADRQRIARWIADLSSPKFAVRQEAMRELEYLGPYARAELTRALYARPTLEVAVRIKQLLKKARRPVLVLGPVWKGDVVTPELLGPGVPGMSGPGPRPPGPGMGSAKRYSGPSGPTNRMPFPGGYGGAPRPSPGTPGAGPGTPGPTPGPASATPGGPAPGGFPGGPPGTGSGLPPPALNGGVRPGNDPGGPALPSPGVGDPDRGPGLWYAGKGPFGERPALPGWLRPARAAAVLERIGTADAVAVLRALAQGEGEALPTQEARAALKRLHRAVPGK